MFLCQECAKLRDLPHSEPELREGPSCLASSMPITEEARAKGAAGSNSGCKDPKQIDPRETWDVSRSKKLNDEMEQLGCSTKSEFLGRNGRPGDNYKAAVVEGSHAERDNNAGGSTATTLPTAVQDEKATVCQRERESQPKEVLEVRYFYFFLQQMTLLLGVVGPEYVLSKFTPSFKCSVCRWCCNSCVVLYWTFR